MKKIFVDMDGVLSDFSRHYTELFGRSPAEVKKDPDRQLYGQLWDKFLDQQGFANLPWHDGAERLVGYLHSLELGPSAQLCIMTSAGGFHRQREVMRQKVEWLDNKGIGWPAVVVPGRKYKAGFAAADALILDDTYDVCADFQYAGGAAIHVVHGGEVIEEIANWLG